MLETSAPFIFVELDMKPYTQRGLELKEGKVYRPTAPPPEPKEGEEKVAEEEEVDVRVLIVHSNAVHTCILTRLLNCLLSRRTHLVEANARFSDPEFLHKSSRLSHPYAST